MRVGEEREEPARARSLTLRRGPSVVWEQGVRVPSSFVVVAHPAQTKQLRQPAPPRSLLPCPPVSPCPAFSAHDSDSLGRRATQRGPLGRLKLTAGESRRVEEEENAAPWSVVKNKKAGVE